MANKKDTGQRNILICKNILNEDEWYQTFWYINQNAKHTAAILWVYFMQFQNNELIRLAPSQFCAQSNISRRTFDNNFKELITLGFIQQNKTNDYTFYATVDLSHNFQKTEHFYTYIISFLDKNKETILKIGKTNNLERRFAELTCQYGVTNLQVHKIFTFNSEMEALKMEDYLRDKLQQIKDVQYIPLDRFKNIVWNDNLLA